MGVTMTAPDVFASHPPIADPFAVKPQARFLGSERVLWWLLARGAVLVALTLGIYRFWLATDTRRYLWSNTEIVGSSLEYTGTALELLIGFLIAIAVLVPVYGAFFIAALDLGLIGKLSGTLAFLLLLLFGQFAVYRARRYRLTRTLYRGVYCNQDGSGWLYALRAWGWWLVVVLSLGLLYPWAQASLERYKMRHTFYGDLQGHFDGRGGQLFLRGLTMWLVIMGPPIAGVAFSLIAVDWPALAIELQRGGDRLEKSSPAALAQLSAFTIAIGWSMIAAVVLYPAFQAVILRWWLSGIRLGALEVTSKLRTGPIYTTYLRFLGYVLLFILLLVVALLVGIGLGWAAGFSPTSKGGQAVASVVAVVVYVALILGCSTIYQVVVKRSLWRFGVESLVFTGLNALDAVKVKGRPSSAFGEGLADALNVGGL
jgi:uncharacterized membrane protein YjgN (DUF898 family)